MSEERSEWLLGTGPGPTVHQSWPIILRTLWAGFSSAWTDLYPAPDWGQWDEVPDAAKNARAELLALEPLGKRNPGSATDVPLTAEGLRLLAAWGSHSIHTELASPDGTIVLVSHDEGWLSGRLSVAEAETVKAALADEGLDLEWIVPVQGPSWWRRVLRRS